MLSAPADPRRLPAVRGQPGWGKLLEQWRRKAEAGDRQICGKNFWYCSKRGGKGGNSPWRDLGKSLFGEHQTLLCLGGAAVPQPRLPGL